MENHNLKHTLLEDYAMLEEIGKLRCLAWERSKFPNHINFKNYPNGFIEPIDRTENATHYYTTNENGEIVGAIRLSTIYDLNELVHPEFYTQLEGIPPERPFLHISRLIIHPDYRKMGIKEDYRVLTNQLLISRNIAFALLTVSSKRAQELCEVGYKSIKFIPKGSMPEPYDQEVVILSLQDIQQPAAL